MDQSKLPNFTDTEVMLPGNFEITGCPALFWSGQGGQFCPHRDRRETVPSLLLHYHPEHQLGDCEQKINFDHDPALDATSDKADTRPLFWRD